MNKRDQELFAGFFEELYEAEQVLDFIKQQLTGSSGFDAHSLFQLVAGGEQQISIQGMRAFLTERVAANEREIYQIFERFDWGRQGSISRDDFLNEITPYGRRPDVTSSKGGAVTAEIEGHFISLVIEIVKRLRILEVGRKQLRGVAPYDAFLEIDQLRSGALGIGALQRFMRANDFNPTDRQMRLLLHALRRRCYRDVNLQVFCETLDPLQFGEYASFRAQLDQQREQNFLRRSRHEEQAMRRSRVEAQRVEHELQKAGRKRQAQLERQLELEDRVAAQVLGQQAERERLVRRALLEEDKSIRHHLAANQDILHQQYIRNVRDRLENEYLNSRRLVEEQRNAALAESAMKRQQELQRSRRIMEREQEVLLREQVERKKQLVRQAALQRELQDSKRRIFNQSKRRYEEEAQLRIQAETRKRLDQELARKQYDQELLRQKYSYQDHLRKKYEEQLLQKDLYLSPSSRPKGEDSRRREDSGTASNGKVESLRVRQERELELEKLRAREDIYARVNNRASEYEKELERTRYQLQERRSRLEGTSAYK